MLRTLWLLPLLACGEAERAKDSDTGDTAGTGDTGDTADTADTGCETTWYHDGDGDNFGADAASLEACTAPIGYVATGGDCDDTRSDVAPGLAEVCDDVDQDCDGAVDEDADDERDWVADGDGDSFGAAASGSVRACEAPAGFVAAGETEDCNDADATDFPGAAERCDERDNDCDGETDEEAGSGGVTYYSDADLDGYGTDAATVQACDPPGAGWSDVATDCDDLDADAHPGAVELCNGVDDDCDGTTDQGASDESVWYVDYDGDGYGGTELTTSACDQPVDFADNADDCDNLLADVNPGADERCDGATDEDCDGEIDESAAIDAETWYADADGDGFGDAGSPQAACDQPADHVADDTDCDDTDATTSPDGTEVCDGVADENCDGTVDEASAADAVDHYEDADGDGYGDEATLTHSCLSAGRVVVADDCDDGDAAVAPDEPEVCGDGVDNDCDGEAQGCFLGTFTDTDADVELTGGTSTAYFGRDAAAGDLTGDGQDDLLVVSSGAGTVSLFEGPVTGGTSASADATFANWYDPSGFSAAEYVRPATWADEDVDGDGQVDLVMWYSEGPTSYGLAIGLGPFGSTSSFSSLNRKLIGNTNGLMDGDLGDVDGDGVAEVFLSAYDYGVVGYEVGGASFIGSTTVGASGSGYGWRLTGSTRFDDVATGGDFDGDGLDDLVAKLEGGRVYVFDTVAASMTTADAVASLGFPVAGDGISILDDLDGDGHDDLFWAGESSTKTGYLLTDPLAGGESYAAGVVAASYAPSGSNYVLRPESTDLDGDGVAELFLSAYDDTDAQAWVFYGPHSGSHVPETDADVVFLDPNATRTTNSYVSALPAGDALGTGNTTVLFASSNDTNTAHYGAAWLFDVAP